MSRFAIPARGAWRHALLLAAGLPLAWAMLALYQSPGLWLALLQTSLWCG